MPREIGVAFDKIQMTFYPEYSEMGKDYAVVSLKAESIEKADVEYRKFNGEDMTLGDYLSRIIAIRESVKVWLKEHAVNEEHLNF